MGVNMLNPKDLKRVAIVGTSCSGKTTLASQLSKLLSVPHIELDALHWLPNWQEDSLENFQSKTASAIANPYWLSDGNYSNKVQEMIWSKASAVIWLNYSLPIVFSRGLKRTLMRSLTREELYSGNRESLTLSFMSKDSILYWILTTHKRRSLQYPEKFKREEYKHLNIIEFNHPAQCRYWLGEMNKYFKANFSA